MQQPPAFLSTQLQHHQKMDPLLTPTAKIKASMEATPPEIPSPSQWDTTKENAPLPLTGDCKDTLLQMQ